MATVIINFKGSEELKKALKNAAFHGGFENSSDLLRNLAESSPLVSKELEKLQKNSSKK